MASVMPREVDTAIVGNGPSALILSYILHGHIPVYDLSSPHPDAILHEKLKDSKDLLHLDIYHLTEHFAASRFSYSTQALPANVLLDTLIRPHGETEEKKTCVKWRYDPSRAVSHVVIGNTTQAGGQWVDNPVKASWDIGTLSYAGMLSLPGYGFEEHYSRVNKRPMPFYLRPSRREVADYLAAYPNEVGISDAIFNDTTLSGISRKQGGFFVGSHGITCKHLVLASGIFSKLIPPRPLLKPLEALPPLPSSPHDHPLLIVGSGFSAADVIISTPTSQKIIHIFKWAPATSPSPLRACHQQAYPEYAGVYRKMKLSALAFQSLTDKRPRVRRASSSALDLGRNWDTSYEGLPNTEIINVRTEGNSAIVRLRNKAGDVFERIVSGFAYVVGRRGSFDYLEPELRREIAPNLESGGMVSAQTMREKANEDLEVAENVFIIGSLTGDSLIRFAYGGCTYTAGNVMGDGGLVSSSHNVKDSPKGYIMSCRTPRRSAQASPAIPAMNGLEGHESSPRFRLNDVDRLDPLDRRKEDDRTN